MLSSNASCGSTRAAIQTGQINPCAKLKARERLLMFGPSLNQGALRSVGVGRPPSMMCWQMSQEQSLVTGDLLPGSTRTSASRQRANVRSWREATSPAQRSPLVREMRISAIPRTRGSRKENPSYELRSLFCGAENRSPDLVRLWASKTVSENP